ncbi:hypothetical protein AGMMS49991_11810 [Spirochaetia bacterium]|nr:hypothetical protein AGMMS49991_11810 [Spirochaetia bacterium]
MINSCFKDDIAKALNFIKVCKITGYLGGYEDVFERLLKELILMKDKSRANVYTEIFSETTEPSCASCKHGPYDCKNEACFHCENHAFYEPKQA